MKKSPFAWACLGLIFISPTALGAPALEATSLYKTKARGCRALDRSQWPDSVTPVLEKAKADLKKVELCNNDRYAIFTIAFNYDPDGPNDTYYNKIFVEVAAANGYRSYAFVDPSWGRVTEVEVQGKNNISVEVEDFAAPEGR